MTEFEFFDIQVLFHMLGEAKGHYVYLPIVAVV